MGRPLHSRTVLAGTMFVVLAVVGASLVVIIRLDPFLEHPAEAAEPEVRIEHGVHAAIPRRTAPEPPAVAEGEVAVRVEDDQGNPLRGALVSFEEITTAEAQGRQPIRGLTDSRGDVRLEGIPTGERLFFVFVRDTGWFSGRTRVSEGPTRLRLRVPTIVWRPWGERDPVTVEVLTGGGAR